MGGSLRPAPPRPLSLPALALACVIFGLAPAQAEPELASISELRTKAEQALRDHFPARAATLLRQILNRDDLPEEEQPGLSLLLVESLLRSGHVSEAQILLETGLPSDHPERPYWQTLILALQDRKDEAVFTARQALPLASPRLRPSLILTLAALLEDTGHPGEAVLSLEPLLEAPEGPDRDQARLRAALILRRAGKLQEARDILDFQPAEGTYLAAYLRWIRGEIDLAAGEFAAAAQAFDILLDDEARTPAEIASLSEIGRIQALLGLRQTDAALESASVFISGDRSSGEIETTLDLLRSQDLLGDPRIRTLLETWTSGEDANRQAVASFFLARSLIGAGEFAQAIALLSRFEGTLAQHDMAPRAILLLGELHLRQGDLAQASRLVEDLFEAVQDDERQLNRKWMFLSAEIQALRGDWTGARDTFRSQRLLLPDQTGAHARYNAALLSRLLAQERAFDQDWTAYTALPIALTPKTQADVLLEAGLSRTAERDAQGLEDLETFLQDFPEHPRVPEALLALAEHHLSATPPQVRRSQRFLDRLESIPSLPDRFGERRDYLAVWLAAADRLPASSEQDATPDPEPGAPPARNTGVEERAAAFLERWPQSASRPIVRLKLAEYLLNKGDSANALIQLRLLARENPQSPLAEQARFLAGKALVLAGGRINLSQAISEWDAIAQGNGPLALRARLEQALALTRDDRRQDALVIFDALLGRREVPEDLRITALLAKGETLYVLSQSRRSPAAVGADLSVSPVPIPTGVQSPREYLDQAIATFQTVAAFPGLPPEVRDEARYRLARCHEQNGDLESTLGTLLEVANSLAEGPRSDWSWYFRAGLEALRILDRDRNWEAALQLAKRLASVDDPRAAEAAVYADRLRLEHFIFED